MTAIDSTQWNETSYWSEEAEQAFTRSLRRGRRGRWVGRLLGRNVALDSFEDVRARLRLIPNGDGYRDVVPLRHVVGSVGKAHLFTRSFDPVEAKLRARWKRAYGVARGMRGFRPIDLYRVGDEYYVVDGHFRLSVARAMKSPSIEAVIRRWTA